MLVSWPVEVPNESPFTLQNIPFGIFSTEFKTNARAGSAIGSWILDLSILESHGCFNNCFSIQHVFDQPNLNTFAALPSDSRSATRQKIISLLGDEKSILFNNTSLNQEGIMKMSEATMHLPMHIGGFTDFMCSRTHVDNCCRIAKRSSIPASFFAMPTAYNGRASSIVVNGTPIHRPKGMIQDPKSQTFSFKTCEKMDYELEMGFFVSKPVPFGHRIKSADDAKEHIFGFVLLNDWSARDIQSTEMQPLGPFNGKASGTSISPWIITLDALEGASTSSSDAGAVEAMSNVPQHLKHSRKGYTWDITLEAFLNRPGHTEAAKISTSNLKDSYWSPCQMLAHHASSGCGLRTGDLLGTGTISGPSHLVETSSLGCLLELNEGGTKSLTLSGGQSLIWLEDDDEVIFEGWARTKDGESIGFGALTGKLLSSVE